MRCIRQIVSKDRDRAIHIMLKHRNIDKWDYSAYADGYSISSSLLKELNKEGIKMRVVIPRKRTKVKKTHIQRNTDWTEIDSISSENGVRITKYKNGTTLSESIDKNGLSLDDRQKAYNENMYNGYMMGDNGYYGY